MKTHELKLLPEFFEMTESGNKKFEIRKNDRDFKKDDVLILKEYDHKTGEYSGRYIWACITCVVNFPEGLQDGYVVLGLRAIQTYYS